MATTKTNTAKATPATTTKATPTTTKAPAAPAPTLGAPLFVFGPWPAKSQAGNTIRAYCAGIAKQLTKAQPQGFTVAQYAAALCANAPQSTFNKVPQSFAFVVKHGQTVPNGKAMQHAGYFCNPAQGWCAPAPAATPAK